METRSVVTVRLKYVSHSDSTFLIRKKPNILIDHEETVLNDLKCDLLLSKTEYEATTFDYDNESSVKLLEFKEYCDYIIDCVEVGSVIIQINTYKQLCTCFLEVAETKYVSLALPSGFKVVKPVLVLDRGENILHDFKISDLLLSKQEHETFTVDYDKDSSVILASHYLIECEDLPSKTESETIVFDYIKNILVFILKERGCWIHVQCQVAPELIRETKSVVTVGLKYVFHSGSKLLKRKKPVFLIDHEETVLNDLKCDLLSKQECETFTVDYDKDSSVILTSHCLIECGDLASKTESETIVFDSDENSIIFILKERSWIPVLSQVALFLTRETQSVVTVRIKYLSLSGSKLLKRKKPVILIDHEETVLNDLKCDLLLSKNENKTTTFNYDEESSVRMLKDKEYYNFLLSKYMIDCVEVGSVVIHGNRDKKLSTCFPEIEYVSLTMSLGLTIVKPVIVFDHGETILPDLKIYDLILSKQERETFIVNCDQDSSVILASHSLIECEDLPTKRETITFYSDENKLIYILKKMGCWIHVPSQVAPALTRNTKSAVTVKMNQRESGVKTDKQLTACFQVILIKKCVSHLSSELFKQKRSLLVRDHEEPVISDLDFLVSKEGNKTFNYAEDRSVSILERKEFIICDFLLSKRESETIISSEFNENGSVSSDLTRETRSFVKVKKKRQDSNIKSDTTLTTFFSRMTRTKYELQIVHSYLQSEKCTMAFRLPDHGETLLSDSKCELLLPNTENEKPAFDSYEDRFREQWSLQISSESLHYLREQQHPKLSSSNLSLPNCIGIVSSCSPHHNHSDYDPSTKCRAIKSLESLPEPVTALVLSSTRCDLLSSTKGCAHGLKNDHLLSEIACNFPSSKETCNLLLSSQETSDLPSSKETSGLLSSKETCGLPLSKETSGLPSSKNGDRSSLMPTNNEPNKAFVVPVQGSSDFYSCCTKSKWHPFVSTSRPSSFLTSYISVLLLSLLVLILPRAILAFSEVPLSQMVSAGEEAEFRCQYMGAFSIVWTINGSMNYPPGVSSENRQTDDVIASILTITALPEYNGTLVQCVATIINGTSPTFNFSPTAILLLISSTSSPTTSPPTVTQTTTSPSGVFLATPLSQIVTIETTVLFHCEHETGFVLWRINNSRLGDFPAASINNTNNFHTLIITEPSFEYNGTKIECIAIFDSERETSPPATLLLQGQLDVVTNISRDSSTISWNPPFSLDLTYVEPDIAYCVEVYNITCGGRELLIHDCNVLKTNYASDTLQAGYIYEYTVIPRSNVEGAQNGTHSQPVRDKLPSLTMISSQVLMINSSSIEYRGRFSLNDTDLPVPSSFTLSLDPLDEVMEEDMDPVEAKTKTNSDEFVTLDVSKLDRHRLWNCFIKPYYRCQNERNPVLSIDELSTHDIQNISVTSPQPGEVRVTGDFIDGSTATGLLTIVISTSEIFYHLIERGSDQLHIEGSLQGVVGGEHSISFFVVEESGLPFNRTASIPKVESVENSNDANQPSIEYSLQSTSTGVCISCTFLDSSATDCVAVVHQRISQRNSSGLMNIESSHKWTRSGDTASGCIEGINLQDLHVGVFGWRDVIYHNGSKVSTVCDDQCIISVIVLCLFLLVIVVSAMIVIVLFMKIKMKKRIFHSRSLLDTNMELGLKNLYEAFPTTECTSETTPLRVESDSGAILARVEFNSQARLTRVESDSGGRHIRAVESDGGASLMIVESDSDNHKCELLSTPSDVFLEQKEAKLMYAEPEFFKKNISTASLDNSVNYANVKKFRNPQGQNYAMVVLASSSGQTKPDDMHKATSEYSQILHQRVVHKESIDENKAMPGECPSQRVVTSPIPCTVENLLSLLRPICSKWKDLGMAFSIDDDYLDQVFTNNEGDEACLRDLLERYMDNGDFKHNWEEIVNFLQMMGENSRANDIYKLHVHPYLGSLSGQTQKPRNLKELQSENPHSLYETCDLISEETIATDEIKGENDFQIDDTGCLAHSEPQPQDEPLPAPDESDSETDLSLPVDEKIITSTPKSKINPRRDQEVMEMPMACHLCDQKADEKKEISTGQILQTHDEPKYTEKDMVEIAESKNPIPVLDDLRESLAAFLSEVVVLLHTVKEEEMFAALKHLNPPVEQSDKPIRWFHGKTSLILGIFGNHKAALVQTSKGADCHPELIAALRSLPNAKLIIALGFAYGLNSKCNLGDVLVSTSIDGIGNIQLEHGRVKLNESRARHTSMSICALNVFTKGVCLWRKFICSKEGRKTKVVTGPLISSPVLVNDKAALDEYLKNNERFKGGEMEGQEVARAQLTLKEQDKREVDFIVIKGVADFCDGSKGKRWQLTASLAAASYAEDKLCESGGKAYNCYILKKDDIGISEGNNLSYPSDVNDEIIENESYSSSPNWKLDGQNNDENNEGATERYANGDGYSKNISNYLWPHEKSGKKSPTVSFFNDIISDPYERNLIEFYNNNEKNADDDVCQLYSSQSAVSTEERSEIVLPSFRNNTMSFCEETLSAECKNCCFVSTKGLIVSADLHPQPQRRFYLDHRDIVVNEFKIASDLGDDLTCCDVQMSGPIGEDVSATMSPMQQKEEVKNVEDITCNTAFHEFNNSFGICDNLQLTCCDVDTVSEPLDEDISGISLMQKEEVQNVENIFSFTCRGYILMASKWKRTKIKKTTNKEKLCVALERSVSHPECTKSRKQVKGNKAKMKTVCQCPRSLMMVSMWMTTKTSQTEGLHLSKGEKGNKPKMKFVCRCERNLPCSEKREVSNGKVDNLNSRIALFCCVQAPTYPISSKHVKGNKSKMKPVYKYPKNLFAVTLTVFAESSAKVTTFTEALQKLDGEKEAMLKNVSTKHVQIKYSSMVTMETLQQQCSDENVLLSNLDYNSIGDEGAVAILEAMKTMTNLQWLFLKYNSIGDKRAVAMAILEAMKTMTNLQWLFLSSNSICADGAVLQILN